MKEGAIAYRSRQVLAGSSDTAVEGPGEGPVAVQPAAAVASDEGAEVVGVEIALAAAGPGPDLLGLLGRP